MLYIGVYIINLYIQIHVNLGKVKTSTLNLSTRKQFLRSSTRSRRIEEKVLLIAAFQRAEAVSTFTLRAKIPRDRGYDILLAIHRLKILLAKNLSFKIDTRLNSLDSLGSSKRFNMYNVG